MKRAVFATLLALTIPMVPHASDGSLLDALRDARTSVVRALLKSGADPNVRDASGATALMYAAIYGSVDDMGLILARGGDVNASNNIGATALMWAAYDHTKVRLLLSSGASANARTTTNVTPLLVAIRYGNAAVTRLLIASGADTKADTAALIREAHIQGSPDVEQALLAAGLPLLDPERLTATMATGPHMVRVGFTERLLTLGAKPPDDIRTGVFAAPLLGYTAAEYGLPVARILLERGADPNRAGAPGVTPLMMAAAAAQPDPALIQLLLDKGADVTARDASGRTALDWALLQGETAAAGVLRKHGAIAAAPAVAIPLPIATPRKPKAAVEAALATLLPAGPKFVETTKCISCHNQTLPSMAAFLAKEKGADVDATLARHGSTATLTIWEATREDLLLGRTSGIRIGGFIGTVAYALAGFAEEKIAPTPLTDALVLALAAQQQSNGSWNVGDIRPPLFDTSALHFTALAVRAVQEYTPAGRRAEGATRIARAKEFLRRATPNHTQDEAFKLLGLVWSKAPNAEIARQRSRVLALQREDGGWGQRPSMPPDAYQTGQVLYALHTAGLAATSAAYQRGVDYLLRTQLQDGTWFMQTRAFGFQPPIDTGFPHGANQFIAAAATSWAAIALTFAM
jgi:ankyrin repeat protein